ncbi:hypothetical protein [Plasmodium yoelii yoelii]|uniref:Uncharacterized protein n=1 Tax=Plasmodium yoelii yoelii TaxID=73239 RepID=Q7RE61_PLAYO|nr:hypothetical protein [Plasmodium yoelii yoelii]
MMLRQFEDRFEQRSKL